MEASAGAGLWGPMTSSLATLNDFSGLSLDSGESRDISMSSLKRASQKPVFSHTTTSLKRRSPHSSSSTTHTSARSKKTRTGNWKQTSSGNGFYFTGYSPGDDKARNSNIEPQNAITLLEESLQEFSTYSKRKAAVLLRQFKQLIHDEKLYGNLNDDSSDINPTSINSSFQDSLSTSEATDSECRTDNTSVSSTPRPHTINTQDSVPMDLEPIHKPCALCGAKPVYYCTRNDCSYSVHSFTDWKRHEEGEKHWPKERFMCLQCPTGQTDLNGNLVCEFCLVPFFSLGCDARAHYLICATAKDKGKTFGRKDHLVEHLQKEHGMSNVSPLAATWKYAINSNWPRQCGFCGERFQTWDQRMRHIAKHYQDGLSISSWKLPFPRPKDFQPRGPYFRPEDDSSDDDDDLDGGKGPSHRTPVPRRTSTSLVGNNHTQGRQSSTSQGNGSSYNSEQRKRQNVEEIFESSKDHKATDFPRLVKPSLALERYLNDTEESIPAVLNLGSSSPSSGFSPRIDYFFHLSPQASDVLEVILMLTELMSKHPQVVNPPFHSTSEAQRQMLPELDRMELFSRRDLKYYRKSALAMAYAVWNRNEAVMQQQLEHMVDVNAKSNSGLTALQRAAGKLLLKHKGGVDAKENIRRTALGTALGTALVLAARNGHRAVAKLQLQRGVKQDSKDKYGQTPLSLAVKDGSEAMVKRLIEQGAESDSRDGRDQTTPFEAAIYGQVKMLLDQVAEPDLNNGNSWMPLSWAAGKVCEAVAKQLPDYGAELDSVYYNGQTPLSRTVGNGYRAAASLLLEQGAETDSKDKDWEESQQPTQRFLGEPQKILFTAGHLPTFLLDFNRPYEATGPIPRPCEMSRRTPSSICSSTTSPGTDSDWFYSQGSLEDCSHMSQCLPELEWPFRSLAHSQIPLVGHINLSEAQEFPDPEKVSFQDDEGYIETDTETDFATEVNNRFLIQERSLRRQHLSSKGIGQSLDSEASLESAKLVKVSGYTEADFDADREAMDEFEDDANDFETVVSEKKEEYTGYKPKSSRTKRRRSIRILPSPPAKKQNKVTKAVPSSKSQFRCKTCDHSAKDATALIKHVTAAHIRPYVCTFSFAGCALTFGNKNEWKRHVYNQHLNLQYWQCNVGACGQTKASPSKNASAQSIRIKSSGNDFNRKDLFTQHLRRMHTPFSVKRQRKKNPEWEEKVRELQISCLKVRRTPPTKTMCPVRQCGQIFEGVTSWDDRMEHVGRHLEMVTATGNRVMSSEVIEQESDEFMIEWALRERIIERRPSGRYRLYNDAGRADNEDGDADGEDE
jgi:ankyrin repeat protein